MLASLSLSSIMLSCTSAYSILHTHFIKVYTALAGYSADCPDFLSDATPGLNLTSVPICPFRDSLFRFRSFARLPTRDPVSYVVSPSPSSPRRVGRVECSSALERSLGSPPLLPPPPPPGCLLSLLALGVRDDESQCARRVSSETSHTFTTPVNSSSSTSIRQPWKLRCSWRTRNARGDESHRSVKPSQVGIWPFSNQGIACLFDILSCQSITRGSLLLSSSKRGVQGEQGSKESSLSGGDGGGGISSFISYPFSPSFTPSASSRYRKSGSRHSNEPLSASPLALSLSISLLTSSSSLLLAD